MKRNIKKLTAMILALSIFTGVPAIHGDCTVVLAAEAPAVTDLTSAPNAEVRYNYSPTVACGAIRYISQMSRNAYFYPEYWGGWAGRAGSECYTSCISMALSYIGINITPNDILTQGGGVTRAQLSWGGATFLNDTVENAMNNYIYGEGKYSPAIIHLNNYSGAGHYVLLAGQVSANEYQVLDPAVDSVWNITFNGNTVTYTVNGRNYCDTVTSACQYYNPDASILDISEELDLSQGVEIDESHFSAYGTVNQDFLDIRDTK